MMRKLGETSTLIESSSDCAMHNGKTYYKRRDSMSTTGPNETPETDGTGLLC